MQLNIEDPILAALVSGLSKEIGDLTTANVFLSQISEKQAADIASMHNLLASRDETIKNMNEQLAKNTMLEEQLRNEITGFRSFDPNYKPRKRPSKVKHPVVLDAHSI